MVMKVDFESARSLDICTYATCDSSVVFDCSRTKLNRDCKLGRCPESLNLCFSSMHICISSASNFQAWVSGKFFLKSWTPKFLVGIEYCV